MHHDWKIEPREVDYLYAHIPVAHNLLQCFEFTHCRSAAKVSLGVVQTVNLSLCASCVTVDSVMCHFGNDGSCLFDFHKLLPGDFQSPQSPFCVPEIQLVTSSLLGVRCEDSWLVVIFVLIPRATMLLWPFWPYSGNSACRIVLAVPDLPVLPWKQTCWKPRRH